MRVPAAMPDTTVVVAAAGDGTATGEAVTAGAGGAGGSSAAARVIGANPAASTTAARTKRAGGAVDVRMKRLFPSGGLTFASFGATVPRAPSVSEVAADQRDWRQNRAQ